MPETTDATLSPELIGPARLLLFGRWWALDPRRLQAAINRAATLDATILQDSRPSCPMLTTGPRMRIVQRPVPGVYVEAGVAMVRLSGLLVKRANGVRDALGCTSTLDTREQLLEAAERRDVQEVLLVVRSGGGEVCGTEELADAIAATGARKPVTAFVDTVAMGAAYHALTACNAIYAQPLARVGGLRTWTAISRIAAPAVVNGARLEVLTGDASGGTALEGLEILIFGAEEDAIAHELEVLDACALARVKAGRRLSDEQLAAIGAAGNDTFYAQHALRLGLLDAVRSLDQVLAELKASAAARRESEE